MEPLLRRRPQFLTLARATTIRSNLLQVKCLTLLEALMALSCVLNTPDHALLPEDRAVGLEALHGPPNHSLVELVAVAADKRGFMEVLFELFQGLLLGCPRHRCLLMLNNDHRRRSLSHRSVIDDWLVKGRGRLPNLHLLLVYFCWQYWVQE